MADLRQSLVDAAVADLVHQLGPTQVDQNGVRIQVDDPFNMARVIEHIVRAAFASQEPFVEEVARCICPTGEDWHDHVDAAHSAISGVYGVLMSELNI
jgi:hypothetical protein